MQHFNMIQEYSLYTEEDREVWSLLCNRQLDNLTDKACSVYLEGVDSAGFERDRIPDFSEIGANLRRVNGWGIEVVPGIIPVRDFFGLLSRKKFCSSTWLRRKAQLDYLEEPDMFHDAFGHMPMLMDGSFSRFMERIASLAERYPDDDSIQKLQRIYWFTIEFGLVKEQGRLKVYGAGICSSYGETNYALSGKPLYLEYDVREVMAMPFYTDRIQDKYFVLEGIGELESSLEEVEEVLQQGSRLN